MQSYDVLMLLVLIAAALWGYWKGFIWQLASLASIFFSYFLAYGLRVQVAKLIDADPPWNMFAAMGIVYLLSSLVIWLGTGMASNVLETFKLKDFDRQIGATFGAAKGAIFCLLLTFFAVTLLGPREQQRICSSTSGRFIARLLKHSGGLIPEEMHAVVDPLLMPLQEKLEQHQTAPETDWAQQTAPAHTYWPETVPGPGPTQGQGSVAWNQNYPPQPYPYPQPNYQPPPQYYEPAPPAYDPRYAQPPYGPPANDPHYAAEPGYADPRYAPPTNYDPRYADPRYAPGPAYPPNDYPPPRYAPPPSRTAPQPDADGYWR